MIYFPRRFEIAIAEVVNNLKTLCMVLLVVTSVIIIVATLMMKPKTGAGSLFGQEANMYGTSAYKSRDAFLGKITIISSVIFVISLLGLVLIK